MVYAVSCPLYAMIPQITVNKMRPVVISANTWHKVRLTICSRVLIALYDGGGVLVIASK